MAENLNLAKLLALLTDMTAAKVILLDTAEILFHTFLSSDFGYLTLSSHTYVS